MAQWAVGLRNKVPATVMPSEIQALIGRRSLRTDDELKNAIFEGLTGVISDKKFKCS